MASWRGSNVREEGQTRENSGIAALFETLRPRQGSKESDKSDDSVFDKEDDAVQDACRVVRRTFSNASNAISEWNRRRLDSSRTSQSAVPAFMRNDSGIGLQYSPRKVRLTRDPTRGSGSGFFDNVTIQLMPTHSGRDAPNSARRVASSAAASLKSLLGMETRNSTEELAAAVKHYTDGLDIGGGWRYTEKQKRRLTGRSIPRPENAPPASFQLTYNAMKAELEVKFSCREGFINTLQEGPTAIIVCKVRLSPGRRSEKIYLQKGQSQYMNGSTFFRGLTPEAVRGKTLLVKVVSMEKAWKKEQVLWQHSVRLVELPLSKGTRFFWRE